MSEETKPNEGIVETPESMVIVGEAAGTLVAEVVEIRQGGANTVRADAVQVTQGGIVTAEADSIQVREGGILVAQGQNVSVEQGGVVGIAISQHVELKDGFVGLLAANEVVGEGRILFDVRTAVVFGVVAGIVSGLFGFLLGRRR